MFKVDFHSHSTLSKDGGISLAQYRKLIESGRIDYIAVTDHNHVSEALSIKEELGDRIIVGEEIRAQEGEVIGLFLKELIPKNLPIEEAIARIHEQGGVAYLPHPFDPRRAGKIPTMIERIIDSIDVIEAFNPRTMSLVANKKALEYAIESKTVYAASSDSHSRFEVGRTYTVINEPPTAENLIAQLQSAQLVTKQAKPHHYLNPLLNIARKQFKRLWI